METTREPDNTTFVGECSWCGAMMVAGPSEISRPSMVAKTLVGRCPHCRHNVEFKPKGNIPKKRKRFLNIFG